MVAYVGSRVNNPFVAATGQKDLVLAHVLTKWPSALILRNKGPNLV